MRDVAPRGVDRDKNGGGTSAVASDHAVARDEQGRWLPGQSANPGGRPRSIRKQLLDELGEHGVAKVARLLREAVESVETLDVDKDLPPVLEWFLEREYPKPKAVELSGPEGEPLTGQPRYDPTKLDAEDRAVLAKLAAKMIGAGEDEAG